MRLGRQMKHRLRLEVYEHLFENLRIRDIAAHELIARVRFDRSEIIQVARVAELVQIENRMRGAFRYQKPHQRGADESGAACH